MCLSLSHREPPRGRVLANPPPPLPPPRRTLPSICDSQRRKQGLLQAGAARWLLSHTAADDILRRVGEIPLDRLALTVAVQ